MKTITIDELRELIYKKQATDPLVFLESIVSGQDPRGLSQIYELTIEIEEMTGGEPSKSDWAELLDLIARKQKYSGVDLKQSQEAAKTLAEYLYPKRKQVEKSNKNDNQNTSSAPLTKSEILEFGEIFNANF